MRLPKTQYDFVIRDLYYNNVQLPVSEFHIEKYAFVLRRAEGCVIASLLTRSWETSEAAEQGEKEGKAKLMVYLWICSAVSLQHPQIITRGKPHQPDDKQAFNEVVARGRAMLRGKEFKLPSSMSLDKVEKLIFTPEGRAAYRKDQREEFKNLLTRTKSIYESYLPVVLKTNALLVATQYCSRVMNPVRMDFSLLIDSMICLEALFNDGTENIAYKIRIRAGSLLGLKRFDGNKVINLVRSLYDKRSKIVHGSTKFASDEIWHILEIQDDIEIVTMSCLKYFYILAKHRKNSGDIRNEVLSDLDRSLLDKELRKKLEAELDEGMKDFGSLSWDISHLI